MPDDVRCARESDAYLSNQSDIGASAFQAVEMLRIAIEALPPLYGEGLFSNAIAAQACFARTYRELRAAVQLALLGYHTTVYGACRAAWESALVARNLAKSPELADKWLKNGEWVPPGDVVKWMKDVDFHGLTDEQRNTYTTNYRVLSSIAHATARASMWTVNLDDNEVLTFALGSNFVKEDLETSLTIIAATALFSCFAFRNSAAHPIHIDPEWQKELMTIAERVAGEPLEHLHLDWDQERVR